MYRISASNKIRNRYQLILASLFLLILVTDTFSAPEVDSIHVELYLSYSCTRSLVARGDTLWAGTDKGGVARYVASDTSLLHFITSDGLAGNEIRRIIPAEEYDAVWAATNNGFSYVSEREIRSYTTANSVPLKRISDIAAIGDRVAVASEPGLSVFKNGQLEKLFPFEAMFSGRVAYGKDSTLWAADMYGIYKVENKILKKIDTPSDISLNLIYTMAVDSDNRLWIAGDPGPDLDFTAHYDGTEWFICTEENSGLKHSVGRLRFDTAGNLIGASNEGVSRFRNGHWELIKSFRNHFWTLWDLSFIDTTRYVVTMDENPVFFPSNDNNHWPEKKGLENNSIRFIAVDRDNNLWVSPYVNQWGFHRYDGEKWDYFSAYTNRSIVHNMVTAFAQDSLGGLWFGHLHGLSYCFNGEWMGYRGETGHLLSTIQDCIVSNQNVLWAACIGGVMSYDYSEWRVYDTTNGLPFYSANTVTQTSEGKILIADKGIAAFENGKFVLDPETKEWWVHSLRSFDDIIVASTGIGAFIKRKDGPWKKVIEEDIRCTDSEMDQDGRIWIATTSKGIIVLDTTASIICNISIEEDLPCEYISDIAYSRKDDKMWVATGSGLASVTLFNKNESTINQPLKHSQFVKPPSRITGVYDLRGRRIMNETEKPVLFNNSAGTYLFQSKKLETNKKRILIK